MIFTNKRCSCEVKQTQENLLKSFFYKNKKEVDLWKGKNLIAGLWPEASSGY